MCPEEKRKQETGGLRTGPEIRVGAIIGRKGEHDLDVSRTRKMEAEDRRGAVGVGGGGER